MTDSQVAYPVPPIHDEPLASVCRVLSLERGDRPDHFRGGSLPQLAGRIYGGQVLAQGLLAAAATVPENRPPHSVHGYFLRGGVLDTPIDFDVERLHDGRSFSQRRTSAAQGEVTLLSMISSWQTHTHSADMSATPPAVPAPEELTSALEIFRNVDHPVAKYLGKTVAFDVRHVQGNLYLGPPQETSNEQQLWMRSRGRIPAEASQVVHRALLTYACDQMMLEPALRAQGLSWRTEGMSLATLDHAQWFHRDVDINDWLLFVQDSPTTIDSRSLVRAQIFNRAGQLVSTVTQEGMIRLPRDGGRGSGRWEVRLEDNPAPAHTTQPSHAR